MNIPFVNLKRMHEPIRNDIDNAIKEVVDNNNYINGKQIESFEKNFAEFIGSKHMIGVSSGTDALFLALKALDVDYGDIVITVPNTFIATTEAISMAGAKIAMVDVDEISSNMCPNKLTTFLENAETDVRDKIKAIIFVNLYGNPEGLESIHDIAAKYKIPLISDAAQAHGAMIDGKPITDFADMTTYSFFPGKNLGAFGDAGALAVNCEKMAQKLKMLRNHGRTEKYLHPMEAYNCRIDTIQAAILDVKLKSLGQWNDNRIKMAAIYNQFLERRNCFCPSHNARYKHVYHLYVTRTNNRDKVMETLKNAGVSTGIHYPLPLHMQPAYQYLGYKKGDFPISEKLADQILSLPIDGTLTPEEIAYVVEHLP